MDLVAKVSLVKTDGFSTIALQLKVDNFLPESCFSTKFFSGTG